MSESASAAEKIKADTGIDVEFIEAQTRFRLDMGRMHEGKNGQLGYVFIDRQHNPDAVVVFATVEEAKAAADEHPLVDSLVEEDCLDCYTREAVVLADVAGREVILP